MTLVQTRRGTFPSESREPPRPQTAVLLRIESRLRERGSLSDRGTGLWPSGSISGVPNPTNALQVLSGDVSRRTMTWDGISAEIIQCVSRDPVEFTFRAPYHLLLVYEEGVRDAGETTVGNLPTSTLRTLRRRLTFVPAGEEYREWQRPRVRSRVICLYFDPARMPMSSGARAAAPLLSPRVLFESNVLWETAVKLAAAMEDGSENKRYCEALTVVIAHELMRSQGIIRSRTPQARGGLAVWQQHIVARYIEEHLADTIPLAVLANLLNLSSYHFCRVFKESFGVPPRRYHSNRRIERARTLLADPAKSVTETALALGFGQTSSFTAAFRRATGISPTEWRRGLA